MAGQVVPTRIANILINALKGGVDADIVGRMISATYARCYHMSGKTILSSAMAFRRAEVSMGVPGLGEYQLYRTDMDKVRAAKRMLETYCK